MLPLVLAAVLTAEEPAPDLAIFTAPLAPVMGAALGAWTQSNAIVFAPLGVAFTAAEVDWLVDAAVMQQEANPAAAAVSPRAISRLGFYGTWLSIGPVVHSGTQPLNGFFLSPRFTLGAFFVGTDGLIVNALVGIDTGYQVTVGRWYFAFIAGASFGLGVGDNDGWAGPLAQLPFALPARSAAIAGGVNLQLVRVGYAF